MELIDDVVANKFMLLTFNVALCMLIFRISNLELFDPATTHVSGATYLRWGVDSSAAQELDSELHRMRMELLKKEATIMYLQRFLNDDKDKPKYNC
jgi:hypothetical protein